eukprot:642822-Lingulodinium_polyedra.AAC.1
MFWGHLWAQGHGLFWWLPAQKITIGVAWVGLAGQRGAGELQGLAVVGPGSFVVPATRRPGLC